MLTSPTLKDVGPIEAYPRSGFANHIGRSPTLKDVGPIEAVLPKSWKKLQPMSPTLKDVGPIEANLSLARRADESHVSDVERRRPH